MAIRPHRRRTGDHRPPHTRAGCILFHYRHLQMGTGLIAAQAIVAALLSGCTAPDSTALWLVSAQPAR